MLFSLYSLHGHNLSSSVFPGLEQGHSPPHLFIALVIELTIF